MFDISTGQAKMFVSPLSIDNYKVPIGFYLEKQATRINQKIYNIGKSIIGYFSANQNLLSTAIWCYLCINVAEAIAINLTPITHLQECTTTICELWNGTFMPSINVRCNTSDPNYYPFSIFEKCMQTLCEVIDDEGKSLYGCYNYIGKLIVSFELSNSSSVLINLWNQFCPKPLYSILNPKERKNFFNNCFQELCHYQNHFASSNDDFIKNLCSSLTVKQLEDRLKTLEENFESHSSAIEDATLQTLSSGANIGNNIVTAGCALVGLYLTAKAARQAANIIPSLRHGLGHMLRTTAETSIALLNINPSTRETVNSRRREEIRETISELSDYVDEIFSDARSYLSGESGSIYQSPLNSLNNISPIGSSSLSHLQTAALALGGGMLIGGGVLKAIELLKENNYAITSHDSVASPSPYLVTSVTSDRTYLINSRTDIGANISKSTVGQNLYERNDTSFGFLQEIATKSGWDLINSTLSTALHEEQFQTNFTGSHFETTAEEYIDFLLDPSYYNNRIDTEAARIEHSLEFWNNSICLYHESKDLFCRSNFYDYIINLPNLILMTLIRSQKYLCTYIEEYGLWCDWNRFLNLAASKIFSTRNITVSNECVSDYVSLGIEKYEDMGIMLNMTGNCYSENFFLPWE